MQEKVYRRSAVDKMGCDIGIAVNGDKARQHQKTSEKDAKNKKMQGCSHFVSCCIMSTAVVTVRNFQVSTSPLLGFVFATFVPSLGTATVPALAFPSFTGGNSFFPSAFPILSNSCASVVRGGPLRVSSSSPSSSHAGDGERLGAVVTWPCVLDWDLPLRGGPKRRRGVQSSDGEKSGCSG
jgi:hypothetical protein